MRGICRVHVAVAAALVLILVGCETADNSQSPIFRPSHPIQLANKPPRDPAIVWPKSGSPPFPAVVLMHTCAGIGDHINEWAERLTAEGYVVFIVDSNHVRDIRNSCTGLRITSDMIALDAEAAVAYLRSVSYVQPDRIGIIGFGSGGAALRLAGAAYQRRFPGGVPGLRAVVGMYAACGTNSVLADVQDNVRNLSEDIVVPVRLFLGDLDSEYPARFCAAIAERLKARGQPIDYTIYADTTHAFDQSWWGTEGRLSDYGGRATIILYRYSPAVTEDAWRDVKAFFAGELKGTTPPP